MKPFPVVNTQAFTQIPLSRPVRLGCAPCKAMARQKEANREFAERFGVIKDLNRVR